MTSALSPRRIVSVDLIRGAVMVLMALDHVRVYAGVPAGGTTVALFFTRWITHFCAPAFVFLAGTSLALSGATRPGRLALRGLWLVLLELTVLRLAWTFNFNWDESLFAGVIWAIGICMVLMAAIVRLPRIAVAAFGLIVLFGHDLVGGMVLVDNPWQNPYPWFTRIVYAGGGFEIGEGGPALLVLYSIVPWVGVMAAGFGFASILALEPGRRDRWCHAIGLGAVALFVLLRTTGIYGDPFGRSDFTGHPGWLAFLNTTKYPASLQFLLMTLGPVIALIPTLERVRGRRAEPLALLGRVPMFFYLLHIPLIHAVAVAIAALRTPEAVSWLLLDHPLPGVPVPDGYRWSLPLLYTVWIGVTLVLFVPCRWYASVRPRLPAWARSLV